jgi:hypothetical protein
MLPNFHFVKKKIKMYLMAVLTMYSTCERHIYNRTAPVINMPHKGWIIALGVAVFE